LNDWYNDECFQRNQVLNAQHKVMGQYCLVSLSDAKLSEFDNSVDEDSWGELPIKQKQK